MEAWLSLAGGLILALLGITVTLLSRLSKSVNDVKTDVAVMKTELHNGNNRFDEHGQQLKNHEERIRFLEIKGTK